jgi:hypothetical protein
LKGDDLYDGVIWVVLGGVLGGRLLHLDAQGNELALTDADGNPLPLLDDDLQFVVETGLLIPGKPRGVSYLEVLSILAHWCFEFLNQSIHITQAT